jgi:antitoxin Phd
MGRTYARNHFSKLLDRTRKSGPQLITRREIATAVLVQIEGWERLQRAARPSLKALLMAPSGRLSALDGESGNVRRRPVTRPLT